MNSVLVERTFSEVKRLCCAGLDGSALLGGVIERLRRAVPFEAYCASTLDSASGLIIHSLAEDMGVSRRLLYSSSASTLSMTRRFAAWRAFAIP